MKGMDKASMVRRNKLINNLPKYDIGTTPIGYQRPFNSYQVDSTERPAQDLSSMVSAQRSANTTQLINSGVSLATLGKTIGDTYSQQFARKAAQDAAVKALGGTATEEAINAAKEGVTAGISNTAAAGLNALTIIPNAMELVGAVGTKNNYNGPTGTEIRQLSSKYTNQANGVAYDTLGSADNTNLIRTARLRDRGENMKLTSSGIATGASTGATIGSFFGPTGTLVGTGIGTLIGGIGSLFGWNSNESDETAKLLNNQSIVNKAYNDMSYANAATQGLRNEFYKTHADPGLTPDTGSEDAMVGGGEVLLYTKDKKHVTGWKQIPETPLTPRHADNVKVRLKNTTGVGGTGTIDPVTGIVVADEMNAVIDDPSLTKTQKKNLLTWQMQNQDVALNEQDMKIRNFDNGRLMGLTSMIPGLLEMGIGAKQSNSYAKDPVHAINPYAINKNAELAANELASLRYDPYPTLNNLRKLNRQAIYNMNIASLSPAQRMAMLSTYYNNWMQNSADVLAAANEQNNKYRATYANLLAQLGESDAQRKQSANTIFGENYAKAKAAMRKGIETGWQTWLKGANTAYGNYSNNYWAGQNIGLYKQYLKDRLLSQNAQDAANATTAGIPLYKSFSYQPSDFWTDPTFKNMVSPKKRKLTPSIEIPYYINDGIMSEDDYWRRHNELNKPHAADR